MITLLICRIMIAFLEPENAAAGSKSSTKSSYTVYSEKQSMIIDFPDKGLENAIREYINMPEGDIHVGDVNKIKFLKVNYKNVSNLEGIQYLTYLEVLNLYHNEISDIRPLLAAST